MTTAKPIARPAYCNPYAVLAACLTAARREGWSWQRIRAFREAASSGNLADMQAVCEPHLLIQDISAEA